MLSGFSLLNISLISSCDDNCYRSITPLSIIAFSFIINFQIKSPLFLFHFLNNIPCT